jgi:hypothetical protein
MTDRLPGSSFSNPIKHRGWLIFLDDCAGTYPMGYAFVHEDYDPTPLYADDGPSDHRHGWARTLDQAKAEIDEQEDEREDELRAADRAAVLKPFETVAEIFAAAAGNASPSKPVTLAICGNPLPCEHDFFGPGSSERVFADSLGSERVCGKCGEGAMAATMRFLP